MEVPSNPVQLTESFLNEVIKRDIETKDFNVASFGCKSLEVGVLSHVVGVDVELKDSTNKIIHKQYIAKFLKSEFPFEQMFVVESNFYKEFFGAYQSVFPFAVPKALFLSRTLIILERVSSITSHRCIDGCPLNMIPRIVKKLAQMHGRLWSADCSNLAASAGIGSDLTGEAKKEQFPLCWMTYIEDMTLNVAQKAKLESICMYLSDKPQRLEDLHNSIANGPSTFIHGDFHVANLLFNNPVDGGSLWVVDWATCGKGNPMRDLAFFFIVGVRSKDRQEIEISSLEQYTQVIQLEGITQYTLDDWKSHYRTCVLNQFVILAVYDMLSKQLASNAPSEKLQREMYTHFREVNQRACLAVLDHVDFKDGNLLALL